jgi:hypothetical protein
MVPGLCRHDRHWSGQKQYRQNKQYPDPDNESFPMKQIVT